MPKTRALLPPLFPGTARAARANAAAREVPPVLVCHCHRVNDARIEQVLAAGADGVRGVVRATRAGSGCGGCIPALRELCDRAVTTCDVHRDEALAG